MEISGELDVVDREVRDDSPVPAPGELREAGPALKKNKSSRSAEVDQEWRIIAKRYGDRAQITQCPLKGAIAPMRCAEFQEEFGCGTDCKFRAPEEVVVVLRKLVSLPLPKIPRLTSKSVCCICEVIPVVVDGDACRGCQKERKEEDEEALEVWKV